MTRFYTVFRRSYAAATSSEKNGESSISSSFLFHDFILEISRVLRYKNENLAICFWCSTLLFKHSVSCPSPKCMDLPEALHESNIQQ